MPAFNDVDGRQFGIPTASAASESVGPHTCAVLNRLQDVFASLDRHDLRYVVIGGIAAVLHGVPRATFDLDILIEATADNAERPLSASLEAGRGTAGSARPDEPCAESTRPRVNRRNASSVYGGSVSLVAWAK